VADATAALQAVRLADEPVFLATPSGEDSLYIGCRVFRRIAMEQEIYGMRGSNAPARFFDVFYAIDGIKSGRHHPDGVLWVRTGRQAIHDGHVSILDIAPTICELVGSPPLRGSERGGTSLVPRFAGGAAARARVA
jgi:hypothetical protein